jgi:hypothetical protein
MSTTTRINTLVRQTLPKGKPVRIIWHPTGFSRSEILRVVTPAWKNLPRYKRILKLQQGIAPHLTGRERAHIFRISVLTPNEFKRFARLVPKDFLIGRSSSNGRRGAVKG